MYTWEKQTDHVYNITDISRVISPPPQKKKKKKRFADNKGSWVTFRGRYQEGEI